MLAKNWLFMKTENQSKTYTIVIEQINILTIGFSSGYGSLEPNTIHGFTILELYSSSFSRETAFSFAEDTEFRRIQLTRLDTMESLGLPKTTASIFRSTHSAFF